MQPIRILLADDDPGHRTLLERVITDDRPNVTLVHAGTQQEFDAAIANGGFDCALIDFNLSDTCSAEELAAQLRNTHPDCPIIVVSGSDDQDVAIRSFQSGSADFIHKNNAVEPGVLWPRIQAAIETCRRNVADRRRQQRRENRLRAMAETDALTGLANRRAVDRLFEDEGRQTMDRRADSSVIMVDIDHFKRLNDTCGHNVGDEVLRAVGRLMLRFATSRDIVARWGGEEFLIIRPRVDLPSAVRWAEKVRAEVARTIKSGKKAGADVTASFGVYTVRSTDLTLQSIERADEALYQAKRRGRNRVCTWGLCDFESHIPAEAGLSPDERLDQSLRRILPELGPTQREHLTEHSSRVATAAMLVGLGTDLDSSSIDALRLAGLCHDIGKVAVPESVLAKPGPLSEQERFLIDFHADDGGYLCERLGAHPRVSALVRGSHGRYDDPNGKPKDPAAFALSVADAYVAMTSDRPYHKRYSTSEAAAELKRESGKQFDPKAVKACIACMQA